MSIRAIWIVSLLPENYGKVVYSRKFATVERRSQKLHGSSHVNIPLPDEFGTCLLLRIGLTPDSKQFIEWRDKASTNVQYPVVEIKCGGKELWPILIIEQDSILFCCLPLTEEGQGKERSSLLEIPAVSVGFAVLLGIVSFLGPSATYKSESSSIFIELDNYVTLSMPFGTPSDVEPSNVISLYNLNSSLITSKKQPAWKPVPHKGKSSIVFWISESVKSAQSDQPGFQTAVEVFGSVTVKVEIEGNETDVSLTLSHADPSQILYLDAFVIHPSVHTYMVPSAGVSGSPRRLRFTPPIHKFTLCYYCAPHNKEPPIFGVYKMRGDNPVEMLLQLQLNESMKNSFEYCEAIIPFFHRGAIKNVDFKSSHGLLQPSEDKHSLRWNIGTKFPSKSLETTLTAKVHFKNEPASSNDESFCIGKNCYAQIKFKQPNNTISGCNIDSKSVTVSAACKVKIVIEREVHATEYKIWNSYGDLPFPVSAPDKHQELK